GLGGVGRVDVLAPVITQSRFEPHPPGGGADLAQDLVQAACRVGKVDQQSVQCVGGVGVGGGAAEVVDQIGQRACRVEHGVRGVGPVGRQPESGGGDVHGGPLGVGG